MNVKKFVPRADQSLMKYNCGGKAMPKKMGMGSKAKKYETGGLVKFADGGGVDPAMAEQAVQLVADMLMQAGQGELANQVQQVYMQIQQEQQGQEETVEQTTPAPTVPGEMPMGRYGLSTKMMTKRK